jgi:HEPN domain-containing protein
MRNRQNKINPELIAKIWFEKSKEDLKSAKVMLEAHRFTWCAFICQQAIEKYLKGVYIEKFNRIPPYIHKIESLCRVLGLDIPEKFLDWIVRVDKYYIATRYPAYKEAINIKNYKQAEEIYNKTKEILKWLKEVIKVQG